MPDAPDLTVVVLSWNTREATLAALCAVPAAVAPWRARLVCVDNASADGTPAAVRAALPEVCVLENERNLGFARGNDRALPHLEGRHVVFLNSDTRATPGALAALVAYLDAHPQVGIVAPRLVDEDGRPQRTAWGLPTVPALLHQHTPLRALGLLRGAAARQRHAAQTSGPVETVSGACLAIRRDLCERLGGFDPGYDFYVEDVDLCWRARRLGFEVVLCAEGPPVVHVGGASTAQMDGAVRLPMFTGLLRFQRKRLSRRAYALFAPTFVLGILARRSTAAILAPLAALILWVVGRREAAVRRAGAARQARRFLERDVGALLRAMAPERRVSGRRDPPASAPSASSAPRPSACP